MIKSKFITLKIIIFNITVHFFLISLSFNAFATNFNPRIMDEANIIISNYETLILKNGPNVEYLNWLIKGFKLRKSAYFNNTLHVINELNEKINNNLKKIIELDPYNYNALCELYDFQIKSGILDKVMIEKLKKISNDFPKRYEAHLLLGNALFLNANFDEAILSLTKGIALAPKNIELQNDISYYKNLVEKANKFTLILKKYSTDTINKVNNNKNINEDLPSEEAKKLFELALIYLDNDMIKNSANIDKAITYLNKAYSNDPNNIDVALKLAETLGNFKFEYKQAINILTKIDSQITNKNTLKYARNLKHKYYQLDLKQKKQKPSKTKK